MNDYGVIVIDGAFGEHCIGALAKGRDVAQFRFPIAEITAVEEQMP